MSTIQLAYGKDFIEFASNANRFAVLTNNHETHLALTDAEIGAALDAPIDSPGLEEIIEPGDSVLIVVSDATRATGSARIVHLLIRRIIQYGVPPMKIAIVFATGIHRRVSAEERNELLTPFIAQRVVSIDHDPSDAGKLASLGTTKRGTTVSLNEALLEFPKIILTGGIGFHYFAGFTGGRKSVCPGLASAETIKQTHMLALDLEKGGRRLGVGPGLLDGNVVHEECDGIAALVSPAFGINAIVGPRNEVTQISCGDWRLAHRAACADYLENHSIKISRKRDVVIASCGGFPYDINLIQAHKALDMASYACNEGGTIVLLAECRDGLGRADFLKWFDCVDSHSLEARLHEAYEVNGQTAWSLLTKTERHKVYLISSLPDEEVKRMRMIPSRSLADALSNLDVTNEGFIMTQGASWLPRVAL